MHLLAAHINKRGQRIQNRQGRLSSAHMNYTVAGEIQSPTAIWRRQIFPTGKPTRASPKCAEVRCRNHATLRAQSTIGRYGHSARNRACPNTIKFMVRLQVRKEKEGYPGLARQKIWFNPERVATGMPQRRNSVGVER